MISGSCLCGSVRYRAERAAGSMAHCHCEMCRKAHGSAFSTILPVERSGFRWTAGEELLTGFESSPGKRRWFCSSCGSQVISTRDADERALLLRAGCIDEAPASTKPVAHGWVGSMARWHRITDDLPQFECGFPGSLPGVE